MRVRLPKDARAPLMARALVRRTLCDKHDRETRDEVELLVSELVTNAIMHGGSLVTMELDCEAPEGISVEVSDNSPVVPVTRRAAPLDEGGRGMELVELISDSWGVRLEGTAPSVPGGVPRQAQGKVVWFHLAG